jgi:hypothetical protein
MQKIVQELGERMQSKNELIRSVGRVQNIISLMTSVMKRSLNHLPCFVNNAFLERRDDVCEEKAVRLATLPNMRVDASLNAIGVFMFSSALNVVDG